MLTRRILPALAALLLAGGLATPARAQQNQEEVARAFVQTTAQQLLAVINSDQPMADKQKKIRPMIDQRVDVDGIARFCLGRFWRTASAEQQNDYLKLFHAVLVKSITGKLGDYQGVTFTIGRTVPRDDAFGVATVIMRPNTPAANVEWIVSTASGAPRIIDVIAEGTSLRLTQRSDYAAFLAHNNNDIGVLLAAMKHQLDTPA